MNLTLDAGQNLFTLGLSYLFLKFLLPVFMGLVLIGLVYLIIHFGFPDLFVVNPTVIVGLLAAIIVIIVLSL